MNLGIGNQWVHATPGGIACERCGAALAIPAEVKIIDWLASAARFTREHGRCPDPNAPPPPPPKPKPLPAMAPADLAVLKAAQRRASERWQATVEGEAKCC